MDFMQMDSVHRQNILLLFLAKGLLLKENYFLKYGLPRRPGQRKDCSKNSRGKIP